VGDRDLVALGEEGLRDGQAEAPVSTGDEDRSGHGAEPYSPGVRCIQITRFGGPEVLDQVELPDPVPTTGTQVYEVTAAGVNFADTHQTEDSYLAPQTLPLVPGAEFVGTGPDGRRVVGLLAGGGYAERVLAADALVWPVPDEVSDGAALSIVLQGVTAWHALRTCAHLAPGESVVVPAAAGGVGTVAVQLARAWGAGRIVALASSPEKRELALSLGADEAVDPAEADLVAALRAANGGNRVDVALEMTGGPVFDATLRALAPFGRLVTYGQAGRTSPTPVDPTNLMAHSTAVIGFWLAHCFRRPDRWLTPAVTELLAMLADGRLTAVVGGTYGLGDVADAHRALLARESTGKLVLDPRR
jgi:NADPH2:quinone reductase